MLIVWKLNIIFYVKKVLEWYEFLNVMWLNDMYYMLFSPDRGQSKSGWAPPSECGLTFGEQSVGSTCDYNMRLKSIRSHNIVYIVEYIAKMQVEILRVDDCLFISIYRIGSLTLVPPGINVSYYGNFP